MNDLRDTLDTPELLAWDAFRAEADAAGLIPQRCQAGHWQVRSGSGVLTVNFHREPDGRGTVYINGAVKATSKRVFPVAAIRAALEGPPPVAATAADYHADHARVSHTMLKLFRQSRPLYRDTYIARTAEPKEPTDSMLRGTLVHLLQLEPDQWDAQVAPAATELAPDGKKWLRRKGSDHERWWRDYLDSCAGRIPLTAQQYDQVKAMVQAISEHDAGRLLQEPGPTEHAIHWTHEETGLPCKARRDKWIVSRNWTLDIKTCPDVDCQAFSAHCERLGYYRQAAHYLDGNHEVQGEPGEFLWVAVESEYPHCVALHRPRADALDEADAENRQALRQLAECYASGDWRKDASKQINDISRPAWAAANQRQWESEA